MSLFREWQQQRLDLRMNDDNYNNLHDPNVPSINCHENNREAGLPRRINHKTAPTSIEGHDPLPEISNGFSVMVKKPRKMMSTQMSSAKCGHGFGYTQAQESSSRLVWTLQFCAYHASGRVLIS